MLHIKVMQKHNVYQMVFSSSCSVYGDAKEMPIAESHPTGHVTSPYGRTKFFIEQIIKDCTTIEPVSEFKQINQNYRYDFFQD